MKKEDLFEGFGAIDEDLLLRSDKKKHNNLYGRILGIAGAAACFGILLTAGIIMHYNSVESGVIIVPSSSEGAESQEGIRIREKSSETQVQTFVKEEPMQTEASDEELQPNKVTGTESAANTPSVASIRGEGVTESHNTEDDAKEMEKEGACLKSGAVDYGLNKDMLTVISSYGTAREEADIAVNNGGVYLSENLKAALQEYGDTVRYRVFVDIFRDGVVLSADDALVNAELERLASQGYIVAAEIYDDGYIKHYYNTLHAGAEQLVHFNTEESYGYALYLYDEVVPNNINE